MRIAIGLVLVLVAVTAGTANAAFPGKNGKIAFQTNRDTGGRTQIFVINPDGSRPVNVSNDLNFFNRRPAWSADGSRIAYDSRGGAEIWVVNADGSGKHPIIQSGGTNEYPAWSPRGSQIAFVRPWDIFVMQSDGTDVVNLTSDFTTDVSPAWSPNGAQIAFSRETLSTGMDIHVMNTDGTGIENLSAGAGRDVSPNWSPDGSRIVFTSSRDGNDEIYVMDLSGAPPRRLTTSISDEQSPAWSPDGTKIVYARGGIEADIFVMNSDGSNAKQLTFASGPDAKPDWQPDSTPPDPPTFTATDPPSPSRLGQARITGTAEAESTVRLYRDATCSGEVTASGPASEFTTHGLLVTTLADGEHTFWGTATDLPGNVSACSTDSITYVRDTTMPHTTIDSGPGEGEETTDSTPTFTFSANEAVSGFECGVDGSRLAECESPYTTPELSEGEHHFVVRAVDLAGNSEDSPAQRRFFHRPPECANLWITLPKPLTDALDPAPDSVCA